MKRMGKVTLFALGLVILAGLAGVAPGFNPLPELETLVEAASDNIRVFDIACDCRTGSPGFFTGGRGDVFIVNGKIFPAGTLPSGTATNDPTQPVNGVARSAIGCAAGKSLNHFRLLSPRPTHRCPSSSTPSTSSWTTAGR